LDKSCQLKQKGETEMKVLTIGAGVIGTTYSWQMQLAGHELTHFVKDYKIEPYLRNGINIRCLDLRHGKNVTTNTVYRPSFVSDLSKSDDFDYILVSVNSHQLNSVLPMLRETSPKTTIIFLQNMRIGEDNLINKHLLPSRYVIAYPFKAGGGKDGANIDTVIFGNPLTNTVMGEREGQTSSRLQLIRSLFSDADMNPKIIPDIIPYIQTHYIWAAASIGAYLKAGSYQRFTSSKIIRESYLAMREGWMICQNMGIDPRKVTPTRYYYYPFFLLVPFTQYLYRNEGMQRMFEGHMKHSPEEMKTMYHDVLKLGRDFKIEMPYYSGFKKYVDDYFNQIG
jgi:ketopantoate reductase